MAVLVARNWSNREAESVCERVDHAAIFDLSPTEFQTFNANEPQSLNAFIADVLTGRRAPKTP